MNDTATSHLATDHRPADPANLSADWSPIPVGKPNDAYAAAGIAHTQH